MTVTPPGSKRRVLRVRLAAQLAIVMTFASIVPLLVGGWFAMNASAERARRSGDEILLRDATVMATFVETWTSGQLDALGGWMVPFELGGKPALQENLLGAVLQASPSAVALVFVDAQGVPVVEPVYVTESMVAAGDDRPIGSPERAQALLDRLPLTEALEARGQARANGVPLGAGAAIGEPYLPDGSNVPSVPIAIAGPRDEDLVFGVELTLRDVERLLEGHGSPAHGVAVLSAAGRAILGGGHVLLDPELVRHVPRNDSTFGYELGDGQAVHGALATVASTGWTVVVVEPAEVAQAASREIRTQIGQVLGVASLLALAVGLVVARSLAQPVRELRDTALAVAEGRLGQQVDADRGDELGELARAFNHMSERLEANAREIAAQQGEIEAFNRELQQRVEERTRDLEQAQQRLVQSGQLAAVAELGAGMAHELNNPLAAILGLAQVLKARASGAPEEPMLARIEQQAARCRDVVAAMLKLSAGDVDPGQAPVVDLRLVMQEVEGLVGGPFRQRGVGLLVEDPGTSLPVRLDPVAGSRVLAQILNSLRAGLGEGAKLTVTARRNAGSIEIVLQPDRPVAVGQARDDWMASGMGLWVARHLLDRFGGRLLDPGTPDGAWRVVLAEAAP